MSVSTMSLTRSDLLIQQPRVRQQSWMRRSHDARRIRYAHHWTMIAGLPSRLSPKRTIVLPVQT